MENTKTETKCHELIETKGLCNAEPVWYQEFLRLRFYHRQLENICLHSVLFFDILLRRQTEEGIWTLKANLSEVKEMLVCSGDLQSILKQIVFCTRKSVHFPKLFRSSPEIDYTKTLLAHIILYDEESELLQTLLSYSLFIREKGNNEILHIPITWILAKPTENRSQDHCETHCEKKASDSEYQTQSSLRFTAIEKDKLCFTATEKDKEIVKCVVNMLVPDISINWQEQEDKPLFFNRSLKLQVKPKSKLKSKVKSKAKSKSKVKPKYKSLSRLELELEID